jgi:hypothetical protein
VFFFSGGEFSHHVKFLVNYYYYYYFKHEKIKILRVFDLFFRFFEKKKKKTPDLNLGNRESPIQKDV